MKASPRTSLVLVSTLLAGGVVAGSVSQDVLQPANSGFLGTAESFFTSVENSNKPAVQIAEPATSERLEPVAIAESSTPTSKSAAPVTGEVRLAIEPSVSPTPTATATSEPVVSPEPAPTASIEPSPAPTPEPSVSPSSIQTESPELPGEFSPES